MVMVRDTSERAVAVTWYIVVFYISGFFDAALEYFQPTTIARMIVNGRFPSWIPAQKHESVARIVRSNKIACVMARRIEMSVSTPPVNITRRL